jgi:LPS-assembly protein
LKFKELNSLPLGADIDRWFASYHHHYQLPDNFTQHIDLNLVSDLRYPRDFPQELPGNGDSALENRISLTHNEEKTHASIDIGYYINLLKRNPLEDNTDAVHRFPEIRYSLTETQAWNSGFYGGFDLNYVNFARESYSYDELNPASDILANPDVGFVKHDRDGEFNPKDDLIRTGQRLDVVPYLTYPFHLGKALDIQPKLSYRETQYRFNTRSTDLNASNYTPSAARRYFRTDLSAKTQFSRVYSIGDGKENPVAYKHTFEPELIYSSIPWSRRPNHPFFGKFQENQPFYRMQDPVTDRDLLGDKKLQFDYNDRIYDLKTLTYVLNNRIVNKWIDGTTSSYRQVFSFKISQSYDFVEAGNDRAHPWSDILALVETRFLYFDTYTQVNYFPYERESNFDTRVRLRDLSNNFIETGYIRKFTYDENRQLDFKNRTETLRLGIGTSLKYLDLTGDLGYDFVTYKINSWGYQAQFKPPGKCWVIDVRHRQEAGARPSINFSFNLNFGGSEKGIF